MSRWTVVALFLPLAACAADTPSGTGDAGGGDAAVVVPWPLPDVGGDDPACRPAATDYVPGTAVAGWPACISDDGTYHPFDPAISSVARVAAFETIAALLLTGAIPTPGAFQDARVAYVQDQGLASRVARREDEHYPAAAKACQDMTADELAQAPDRCVGPARIQPLLNAAFEAGMQGREPLLNAARVEAGLLWFLYVSVHKEATTCATTKKDCDSSWAYYTGGAPGTAGLGLSRYVLTLGSQAHGRIGDGLLAVRCWRDLDGADVATDPARQALAVSQLDRAALRGVALVVLSRVAALRDGPATGDLAAALWESARILGGVLDREATARDAARAASIRGWLAEADRTKADLAGLAAAIEAVFPCP